MDGDWDVVEDDGADKDAPVYVAALGSDANANMYPLGVPETEMGLRFVEYATPDEVCCGYRKPVCESVLRRVTPTPPAV